MASELTGLQTKGRIAMTENIAILQDAMAFELIDTPAETWRVMQEMPDIHRDPGTGS